MNIVYACPADPDYDQLNLNRFLLNKAYMFRLRNIKSFWVALDGYNVRPQALEDSMARHTGHVSMVFRTQHKAFSEKATFPYEFHLEHGGVYKLNVQEILQDYCRAPLLGKSCLTMEDTLSSPQSYIRTVLLKHRSEQPPLIYDGRRYEIFNKVGLSVNEYISAVSIEKAHEILFAKYRSDLLVIDNDFVPTDNIDLLKSQLAFRPDVGDSKYVRIFYARNPVNGLEYGHGAPKIFPREAQTLRRESDLIGDFTLSVGEGLVVKPVVLGTHQFNWSAQSTWVTAAKECAKLAESAERGSQQDRERLNVWLTKADTSASFYQQCLDGASFGAKHYKQVLNMLLSGQSIVEIYTHLVKGK